MNPQPGQQPMFVMPVPQHNGLGVAGFLIAFVGLFIPTGIVSLLGLILSVAALGRPPRLFAVLGVLLGLLGVLIWGAAILALLFGIAVVGVVLAVLAVMAMIVTETELTTVTADMLNIQAAIVEARAHHGGSEPLAISKLGLPAAAMLDPWGRPYRLEACSSGFVDVVSDGPDGESGTSDDLRASTLDRNWERAMQGLPAAIQTMIRRTELVEQQSWGCGAGACAADDVIIIDERDWGADR